MNISAVSEYFFIICLILECIVVSMFFLSTHASLGLIVIISIRRVNRPIHNWFDAKWLIAISFYYSFAQCLVHIYCELQSKLLLPLRHTHHMLMAGCRGAQRAAWLTIQTNTLSPSANGDQNGYLSVAVREKIDSINWKQFQSLSLHNYSNHQTVQSIAAEIEIVVEHWWVCHARTLATGWCDGGRAWERWNLILINLGFFFLLFSGFPFRY